MKVKKLFNESKEKYGSVFWGNTELAITQEPYPFGPVEDWFFTTSAMDMKGNLWNVIWQPKPDVDVYDDYSEQVVDWDRPCHAEIVGKGYYLD